jgi:hypothetical protein
MKHHMKKKARGGDVFYAGEKSNVAHEAESVKPSHETNDETAAESKMKAGVKPYKKGGKAHHGKAMHHAKGGKAMKHVSAEGSKSHHRLDKPRRATGGRVGSDKSPFSSAHKSGAPERD